MTGMRAKMEAFLKANDMCVLATSSRDRPHCSLMAYTTNTSCTEVYMATSANSTKYANLLRNPRVSLLVDSRTKSHQGQVQALTVEGFFENSVTRQDPTGIFSLLKAAHPHLTGFLSLADTKLLRIRIVSFLLLEGISKAFFEQAETGG